MKFALFATVVGIVAGWAGGGRLGRLPRTAPQDLSLAAGGLLALGVSGRYDFSGALQLMAVGHVILLWFACLNIRRYNGIWLIAVGLFANLFVLVLNHGAPYRPSAVIGAGLRSNDVNAQSFRTTRVSHPRRDADRFAVLGDNIPVAPLHEVLSFGDMFQAFGLSCVLCNAMLREPRQRRLPSRNEPIEWPPGVRLDLSEPEPIVELIDGGQEREVDALVDVGAGEMFWTERRRLLSRRDEWGTARRDDWGIAIDKDPEVSHLLSDDVRRALIDLAQEGSET